MKGPAPGWLPWLASSRAALHSARELGPTFSPHARPRGGPLLEPGFAGSGPRLILQVRCAEVRCRRQGPFDVIRSAWP